MAAARRGGGGKPQTKKVGDWKTARKTLPGFDRYYKEAEIQAVRQEAEYFRRMVLKAFKTSGASNGTVWAGNSPFTKRKKGSAKPLIDTGDLMGSVTIIGAGTGAFFVGVPNNVRTKDGASMVSIGGVHETGKVIVIQITKKMHGFFMSKLKELGLGASSAEGGNFRPGAVLVIKIPKRSFLQATMDAHFDGNKSRTRIQRRIATFMRQKVGTLSSTRGKG